MMRESGRPERRAGEWSGGRTPRAAAAAPVLLFVLGLALPSAAARAQEEGETVAETAAPPPAEASRCPGLGARPAAPAAGEAELPAPTPGPVVALQEAFELARARHPQLRSIREELEKADAMLRQAWGALLPRVSDQVMYTLNDEATVLDFAASLPPEFAGMFDSEPMVLRRQHIVQNQLQIAAPVFNMPIFSAIDTARLGRSLAGLGEEEGARQLLLGVATAYYGALSARELINLQEDAFRTARRRLAAAWARVDAGAGICIDVARAELEVESARLAHQAAILGFDNARQALAGLLVLEELPLPVVPDEEPAPPSSAEELVARAAERRPDVALRRAQVDMAEQGLWSAWTQFFPTLSLAWQLNTELTEPADMGGRRNAWALVLVLNVPLYDQSRYGLLDQRRAEIRQAEINVDTALLAVETEIRSALREYESSLTSIDTAERQVSLAREALRLAEAGLQAGAATSLDVDDAQQRVNQARINVSVQRYRSRMALIKLLFLAGEVPGGE